MSNLPRPPRGSRWLLERVLHPIDREPALADLDEEFETRVDRDGHRAAARWYRSQLRQSCWPALVRRFGRRAQRSSFTSDLRWAWRGLKARRSAALLHVLLFGLATAASTIVFAAADAFVYRPSPYPNADRLIAFQRDSIVGLIESLSADEVQALRRRTDLFRRLYPHTMAAPVYVTIGGITEGVRVQDVAPGLFEALGVVPRWGRPLQPADAANTAPVALISETLAGRLFGDPSSAIDRTIDHQAARLRVVGVMPASFRFPTALEHVWRPLDESTIGPRFSPYVGELAPDIAARTAVAAVSAASPAAVAGGSMGPVRAVALAQARKDPRAFTNAGSFTPDRSSRLFTLLLGLAVCLALLTCLNVAGLEIVSGLRREHTLQVLTALGARPGLLARAALLESALLSGGGALVGLALAYGGMAMLTASLPAALGAILANGIDIDRRAAMVFVSITACAWVASAVPLVRSALAARSGALVARSAYGVVGSRRGAIVRQSLLGLQVACSMLLLTIGVLLVQSYRSLATEAKGFDSMNLATLQITRPGRSPADAREQEDALVVALRDQPGVRGIARTARLLPNVRGGAASPVWIEGRTSPTGSAALTAFSVDADYCTVMALRVVAGRCPADGDRADQVVVDEAFARRFFPDGAVIGARFSTGRAASGPMNEIVGVTSRIRLDSTTAPMGGEWTVVHRALASDAAAGAFVLRLDAASALALVATTARTMFPGTVVRAEMIDDRYAEAFGDSRLVAGLASVFGGVAWVVTLAGLYAVVAHLVASRTREIGVRIALGASRRDVRRLVFGATGRTVLVGLALGSAAAMAVARIVGAALHDISPTTPSVYIGVAVAIAVAGYLATRRPVSRAVRIDPAVTLRSE